ncbi:TRAP transporter substrate-binding protein DctP [Desulfovibrio sp. UCD-KL4C]|uniref:TRAP transporter substrate-binding protein DctP n=1 Tax=Desulfovibrio sp. UCD-KL4C TaxID=2578120 RepID=UPI0025BBD9BA|nr:TRAP transporter substrate-binding protein DctP [Desulfovibrio sp. UCD-KL4C]
MQKRLFFVLIVVLGLMVAGTALATKQWKYGHVAPIQVGKFIQGHQQGCLCMAKNVKEKTGGDINIAVFPLSQLGPERSMLEQTQFGLLDMMDCTTGTLGNLVPQIGLLDLFFMWPSKEVAHKVITDPEFLAVYDDLLLEKGLVHIGYSENEMRDFDCTKFAVVSPAEMKGIRVRVIESPVFLDSFRAMGANPVGMPFGEVYTALQQGVIDMQDNPNPTSVAMKFSEVAKYFTRSGHAYTCLFKLMSRDLYEGLSDKGKEAIRASAKSGMELNWAVNVKIRKEMEKKALQEGCIIKDLTPEEREAFRNTQKDVWAKYAKKCGNIPKDPKYGKYAGVAYFDMIQDKIKQYSN